MATRSVRAVRRDDGAFEALEPVEVPNGTVVELRYEADDSPRRQAVTLPAHPGMVLGTLTRAEIYDDR